MANLMDCKNTFQGIISGVAAGAVTSIYFVTGTKMDALASVINMSGNNAAGMGLHLVITALIGAVFAMLLSGAIKQEISGVIWGVLAGIIVWAAGAMTVIPYLSEEQIPMGSLWNAAGFAKNLPLLGSHCLFGLIMGFVYGWMRKHESN